MKILTGTQIRQADAYTIEHEPIDSINLMERAAETIAQWIGNNTDSLSPLLFVVGNGNNGGDGLAVARMLFHAGFDCSVIMPLTTDESRLSADCLFNLTRLPKKIQIKKNWPESIAHDTIIVDALFGTGVNNRPLDDRSKEIIDLMNSSGRRIISIDMPSGMLPEFGNKDRHIIKADSTLTLELPKLSQMLPEAGDNCGDIEVLSIGLNEEYIGSVESPYNYVTREMVASFLKPRSKFAHKNTFGHALLICGSEGMIGASILATSSALRSGCGIVTSHIPREERHALHANCPSAVLSLDSDTRFSKLPTDLHKYKAIGVGCGLGTHTSTAKALENLLQAARDYPIVIDADALNLLSQNRDMLDILPSQAILTPHVKELQRLIGEWHDEEHKLSLIKDFTTQYNVIVVLKGAHTMVCTPDGRYFFNSSGTPAMAKGGSGDILTGLLTGLLARGYTPLKTTLIGVYIHGIAGERAAEYYGAEAMCSSDIIDFLAEAMKELE